MESASKNRPVWEEFSAETRHQLLEEDRVAWRQVCTELLAIIGFGVLLGSIGVLICIS